MDPKTGLPRRIVKETQRLQQEPVAGINCMPFEDNMRHFNVVLAGPGETAYQGKLVAPSCFAHTTVSAFTLSTIVGVSLF
jgi:ubiquitin-protein ligase